jgi:hypothetical protein
MKLTIIALLLLILISLPVMFLLAVFTTKNTFAIGTFNVTVNISRVAQVSIKPTWLFWNYTIPGTDAGNQTIEVKNIGSVNISDIYAWVTTNETEQANPNTLINSTDYSSGGFIVMSNDSAKQWFYVGRQEWNLTTIPTGARTPQPSATTGSGNWSIGYFKNITNEYLWVLVNGTGTTRMCNITGTKLYMMDGTDNATTQSRDMIAYDNNTATCTADASGNKWGYCTFAAGPMKDYCIGTYWDCTKLYVFRYDYRSVYGDNACGKRSYLYENGIVPAEAVTLHVRAWIPYGVPAGNTTTAIITLLGTGA